MLLPASAEFIDLCQSQLWLLVQTLGASAGVVYLADEVGDKTEARLVQVAAAPDGINLEHEDQPIALPSGSEESMLQHGAIGTASLAAKGEDAAPVRTAARPAAALTQPDRLMLPLMHDEMVLGLLVTERLDRMWHGSERQQVERVVQTLSLACVMDKRSQWLQHRQQHQAQLQIQQHDLLDNLIHQFRNPLTALRTFGKLLLKRLPEDDRNRVAAASIVRESDRLQELLLQIDQAIAIDEALPEEVQISVPVALPSAGTLGEASLEIADCDVREILEPLLISAAAVAQDKQIEIHAEMPEVLPPVPANQSALREVLSNLIDNAVKYAGVGCEVHVRLQMLEEHLLVRVTDNGAGIPDVDLPKLFQRHFRGVQAATDTPGTGLGLAIARELIQQMQGDIRVYSPLQSEGWLGEKLPQSRGVTFVVQLPLADRV